MRRRKKLYCPSYSRGPPAKLRKSRARKKNNGAKKERQRAFRLHQRQSPSREGTKCCIFLPILEREGESSKKQRFTGTCEGNFCSMKVAKHAPATRFRRAQQRSSRHRAASEPLMRNARTLVVLEHGRPCQNPIPAVRVDVANLLKPQL